VCIRLEWMGVGVEWADVGVGWLGVGVGGVGVGLGGWEGRMWLGSLSSCKLDGLKIIERCNCWRNGELQNCLNGIDLLASSHLILQ